MKTALLNILTAAAVVVLSISCRQQPEEEFWLGADLGWITEYEAKGHKFYNKEGE